MTAAPLFIGALAPLMGPTGLSTLVHNIEEFGKPSALLDQAFPVIQCLEPALRDQRLDTRELATALRADPPPVGDDYASRASLHRLGELLEGYPVRPYHRAAITTAGRLGMEHPLHREWKEFSPRVRHSLQKLSDAIYQREHGFKPLRPLTRGDFFDFARDVALRTLVAGAFAFFPISAEWGFPGRLGDVLSALAFFFTAQRAAEILKTLEIKTQMSFGEFSTYFYLWAQLPAALLSAYGLTMMLQDIKAFGLKDIFDGVILGALTLYIWSNLLLGFWKTAPFRPGPATPHPTSQSSA